MIEERSSTTLLMGLFPLIRTLAQVAADYALTPRQLREFARRHGVPIIKTKTPVIA